MSGVAAGVQAGRGRARARGPGAGGVAGWLVQRVTGIFLVYALAVHLWTVHVVQADRLNWDTITARLRGDGLWGVSAWSVYYCLFIPAVVIHAGLGLWGIVLDYSPRAALRRGLGWALGLGCAALIVYGFFGLRALLGAP